MDWEPFFIIGAILLFFFGSRKGSSASLVTNSKVLDKLNKIRQSAVDRESARIDEIEAEVRRNLQERRNVQKDIEGAADRLRDEFGSGE